MRSLTSKKFYDRTLRPVAIEQLCNISSAFDDGGESPATNFASFFSTDFEHRSMMKNFFVVDQTLAPCTTRTEKWQHRYRLCKHPVDSRQCLNMGLGVYKKHIPDKLTYRSLVGQNYK
jgi:hypothetical protein